MRPALAAVAGLAAAPGWWLGGFLGGIAGWLVERLGGLVGLAWLGAPVAWLVLVALGPALALGLYMFLAHGEDAPYFGGLGGVVAGAALGEALALLGVLPQPAWLIAAALGVALGALGGLAGELGARPRPSPTAAPSAAPPQPATKPPG